MTNEESIKWLKQIKAVGYEERLLNHTKAIDTAIKALEQKPKTGQWIKIKPYPLQMHDYECSECGHETDDNTEKHCSECGCRILGVKE